MAGVLEGEHYYRKRFSQNEALWKNQNGAIKFMNSENSGKTLDFTCPVCGKITDRPIDELKEQAIIICPFCELKLTIHGHMWQDVQARLKEL